MSNKLTFALLTTASICLISCQKDTKRPVNSPLQSAQKESNAIAVLKTNAINYRASAEKSQQLLLRNKKLAKQNIEKFTLDPKQFLNKTEVTPGASLNRKSVIHVPKDYPTLQDAVNKSMDGGKIIIDGTILQSGNVMVDVPNLTIQGKGEKEEKSSTINDISNAGDNLIVTASGVTIKNLSLLNVGVVIVNAANERLMNLDASSSNPGIFAAIALYGSNNSVVKNCNISYSVLGVHNVTGIGIFLDDFSNNNEVANCKVSNTQFTAFDIEGSDNHINNCEAINFFRGFISFDGVSTGNVYTGCVANHSYEDAGFVFLNFTANNTLVTLKNCTANDNVAFASIVGFGGSLILTNCTANSNTRNIVDNIPAGIVLIGTGQTGEFATISKCTANSNARDGIAIFNMNFQITDNTCSKSLGLAPANGILLFSDNTLPMSGLVKGNTTDFNANSSGINLLGITNSTISDNESLNNALCDFNQTNCSGNTITNNRFGTSCTGL